MAKKDPYDIRKIFDDMTLSLFLSLRRNMSRHRLDETEEGFRWEQWQSAKLRSIQEYRKRNRLLIRNANKEADKLIDTVVKDSFKDGAQRSLSRWDRFLNVILKPFGLERVPLGSELAIPKDIKPLIKPDPVVWDDLPEPMPEQDFFKLNEKKIKALQDAAKKDIHKANQNTMRKMDDIYRQVIFKAEMNMAAGAKTLNQAIDMATKDFLERGIDSIVYSDGKRMNIASYAEIALRTVSQRATFAGEGTKRDEWGVYTVVMSAHDNCSPWCLPFQGTVMIDDVYTSISLEDAQQLARKTGYVRLSNAMAEGAFHPACRHTLATFFPGISNLPVKPDEKKAAKNYEAEQRQRYMERTIRKYKRLEAGSLDDMNRVKYGRKVKEWDKRLKQHLAKHPELKRDRIRERIEGEVKSKDRTLALKDAETFKQFQDQLGKDIPDHETFDRIRNSEDWSLVQMDYRRRKRLVDDPNLALPNASKAAAADEKFTKYLFNPDNPKGFAKGNAFESRLGYNANNWQELQTEILERSRLYPAKLKGTNNYGELYEQQMILYGKNGRPANVTVGWIKEGKETRMTSAYIKEAKANAGD